MPGGKRTQESASTAKAAEAKNDQAPEQDDDVVTIGSKDVLTDYKAARGPLQPTTFDASGVERIVGPAVDDNWRPAAVDPDPVEVAHLEKLAEQRADFRGERLGATQAARANVASGAAVAKAALEAERGEG